MNFDPAGATAQEIADAVHARRVTARAVAQSCLQRVATTHSRLNAFTTITTDRALAEADAVDQALVKGQDPGPLAGVPYAVKNLFDLTGVVTTAGSKINRAHPPATRDATAVSRLHAAGAVCLGALNMGEYAYDFTNENCHDGNVRNPRNLARSAGGSSGGSGAAVAAGLVSFALGTDTNGSIRVPASFCGIWGLKPTYGRLSRAGAFPFVDSLDHIGPFARSVSDLALTFDVMQGSDPLDAACSPRPAAACCPHIGSGLAGLRVAVLDGYFAQGGETLVHAAVDKVAAALGVTRRLELPVPQLARAAAYLITATEGGQFHLDRLRSHAADFDPPIRDRLLAGVLTPSAWYLHAQKFRAWWREQLQVIFRDVDVLLAPATPLAAPVLGQETMVYAGREVPLRPNIGLFTQPISFIGLPVVAAPVHAVGPLPVAVQLIGAPWSETSLLRVARVLEAAGVCTAPVAHLS